ncbi:LysR family transcriptional regulator [Kitasatospora sp. NPDC002040]|uniref:LysR family transcriptional regulator n=1 Tax=Kitasatospora sp. NPDC002040 TaxID=3154661 RepID=UPI0033318B06
MDRPELGLQQLHAFTVLAAELHFGRAAERLGIAQPPLSQQIRRLETRVGHPLFTRGPGGVGLTPAGQELLPAARRALDGIADGLDAARRTGSGEVGRLRIGFSASLALTVLPGLLRAHREQYPGVELELRELTTAPQLVALREQAIDVGLLREPPAGADAPGLATATVLTEELVAVLPAAHPLAARRAVPVAGLADDPFVLLPREAGPTVHERILRLCREEGFEPRLGQRAVEWQTVAALVGAGLGVSIAPAGIRRIRIGGVAYRRLEAGPARAAPGTVVAAAWRRDDPGPLVARFLRLAGVRPE